MHWRDTRASYLQQVDSRFLGPLGIEAIYFEPQPSENSDSATSV